MYFTMMNEYGVGWPFWNRWATTGEHPYLCEEEDPPLPHLPGDLAQAIRRWTRQFNEHFDDVTGWPSGDMARAHKDEGRRLHEQVVAALPDTRWTSTTGKPTSRTGDHLHRPAGGELAPVQLGVGTVSLQQLVVRPLLHDRPVDHDEDPVSVPDRGQPVGDDE